MAAITTCQRKLIENGVLVTEDVPRKKWRQLFTYLCCGGLSRKKKSKHNDSAVALEGTRSRNDTISINFEQQEGNARETEVSNSPHAGIEVERFQGREPTAHSHVQTIEVHQQWPPGDAQADLLGSDMQMKTVRDRAGATKVDVSNEVTDMASGNATTARAMTWKDMQSVAESTHEDDESTISVPPESSWQMLAKGTTRRPKDNRNLGMFEELIMTRQGHITYSEPEGQKSAGHSLHSRSLLNLSSLVSYNLPPDWSAEQSKPPFTASEENENVDFETSYSLNFDLEPREVQETTSELSDLDKQGYCEPSSTSIGDMKVGPLTESVVSSFASTDSIQSTSTAAGNIQDAQLEQGKEEIPAYTDPLESECSPLEVEDVPPSAGLLHYIKPSRVNALAPTTDFPNMTGHGTDKLRRGDLSTRNRIPNSSETDTFRATTSDTVTSCITTACAADDTTASSTDATIKTTSSAAYAITGITGSTDRSKNFTADAQAITEIATTRTTATTTCAANDTKSTTATSASATGATMSTTATTTCTLDATTRIAPTAANVTNVPIDTMIASASATMEINTSVIPLSTPNTTRGATTAPFNPEDVTIVSTTSSAASTAIKAVKEAIPVQPTGDEECPDTTDVENNMKTEADGSDRHLQTQTQGATTDLPYENSQAADSSSAERLTRGRTWQQRSPKTRSKAASHLEDESKQRSVNITSNESTFSPLALSNRRSISGEVVISVNPLFKQNPRGECQPVPGTSNSSIKRNTSIDGLPADRMSSVIKPGNLMSTQGPSQPEGERDVRPKTSSHVAFHTTEPDRTRVNRKPLPNSTGASSSVGLEVDDADQLLEYLSVDNTIQCSSPIPENLKQFITKKAQERGVECAAIYQCPKHAEKLNIMGYKATSLKEFVPNMREEFPGFSFLLTDSDDARHVKEYGDKENILLEATMSLRDNRTDSFIEQERSTSGLILTGRLVKPHHKYNPKFAVVPAHLVLKPKDFCEQLVMLNGGKNIHQVRKEMRAESDLDQYLCHQYNSPCKRDMEDIPWFGYRHFMETPPDQPLPTSQTPHDQPLPTSQTPPDQPLPTPTWEKFTNDIALLQMKEHQPEETIHESISNANLREFSSTISHMPDAFTEASFRGHDVPIGAMFPLRRVETLEEMGRRSVRVFVDMKKGYMVPCGDSIDPGAGRRAWTYSIQFVSEKIFRHGDCGLIVYVQDIRKPHKLYPFGLYIGKSTRHHECCKRPVQTAVVLSQGIDDIAHNYRHLVRDLKPLSDRTDSRHVDGHNGVGNLSQIPTPTSTTSGCGGASAAAAIMTDSGYMSSLAYDNAKPQPASYHPADEGEDEEDEQ